MDADQDKLLREVHGALFNPISSQSPFRSLGEGAVWQQHQLPINDDGLLHPQYVEWAAERGSQSQLALLETLAAANPLQYPDRADDIKLAGTTLSRVRAVLSGQTPPNIPVKPVTAPDTPTPAPAPAKGSTITTDQLVQWGRDATTVLGVIATWATALHSMLGQYLDGSAATTVPSMLGAATVAAGFSTVRHKNALLKENMKMKGVAPQRRAGR